MAEIDEERLSELFDRLLGVRLDFTGFHEGFDTWVSMANGFTQVFARDISPEGMDDPVAAEYGTAIAGVVASMLASFNGKDCEAFAAMELCARAGIALGCYGTATGKFSKEMIAKAAMDHAEANRQGLELKDLLDEL